jgi:hypothetical protein
MRALTLLMFCGACQVYDFEKVSPLALGQTTQGDLYSQPLKPNLMLLVDRSGSMGDIDPGSTTSRIDQLKATMGPFLDQNGGAARFGLAYFPRNPRVSSSTMNSTGCDSTDKIEQFGGANVELAGSSSDDVTAELQAHSAAIRANISAVSIGGGTPTAASLQLMGQFGGLTANDGRADYVLLLTDGAPNCNANNRNQSCVANNPRCNCTLTNNPTGCDLGSTACATGCLDRDGSVDEVKGLRSKNITTIVIGFGAATSAGAGPATLQAMAEAGGYLRQCGNNSDCGSNNTCEGATAQAKGLCQKKYFQAANGAELAKALKEILDSVLPTCSFQLSQTPADPKLIAVTIDGVNQERGPDSWEYRPGFVDLKPRLCDQLTKATAAKPVDFRIRVLNTL